MDIPGTPVLTVVEPGGGEQTGPPAFRVAFKLWSRDTCGAFAVIEHPFPPGAIAPPHMHRAEDEYSIVVEGEMGFRSGDREVVLGAGGYISKPRGQMHSMWNAGRTPARIIELITPGGFERYFRELADLVTDGSLDPGAAADLARKYDVTFGHPDWLDDVVERYGLTPPHA
ncbi:MAG: cupin domain-containing protein [Actinobacteria bacterium]|nr:cupin domain-containing protein [Actinomycetota bacterium]